MERLINLINLVSCGEDASGIEIEFRSVLEKYGPKEVGEVLQEVLETQPREKLKIINERLRGSFDTRTKIFGESEEKYRDNKYEESINDLDYLINSFKLTYPWQKNFQYLSPRNPFDLMLHSSKLFGGEKPLILNEPLSDYCYYRGYLKYLKKEYDDAIIDLLESIKYNNFFILPRLILSEIYFLKENDEEAYDLLVQGLRRTYKKSDMADIYASLGKYYTINQNKEAAIACLMVSTFYKPNVNIDGLFKEAEKLPGEKINFVESQELNDVFKKYKIQLGPSKEVIEVIDVVTKLSLENKMYQAAYDVLKIGYDLTNSPYYLNQMEAIKK